MGNDKVYIIILQYNNWQDTVECLHSITAISYDDYAVVVVDNNSSNDSLPKLKQWLLDNKDVFAKQNETVLIENIVNNGYAGGNNLGIKYALEKNDFSYVWLLNNDVIIDPAALEVMVNIFKGDGKIGICGSKVIDYFDNNNILSLGTKYNRFWGLPNVVKEESVAKNLDGVQGCSMLIKHGCFVNIGLLPEEYFMYYEESDYCLKVIGGGYKIATAVASIIFHKEGASSGVQSSQYIKNVFSDLLCLRNRLICGNKYLKIKLGLYLGMMYSALKRVAQGKWGRAYYIICFVIVNILTYDQIDKHISVERIRKIATKIS